MEQYNGYVYYSTAHTLLYNEYAHCLVVIS